MSGLPARRKVEQRQAHASVEEEGTGGPVGTDAEEPTENAPVDGPGYDPAAWKAFGRSGHATLVRR